jgi:hypothetical protein
MFRAGHNRAVHFDREFFGIFAEQSKQLLNGKWIGKRMWFSVDGDSWHVAASLVIATTNKAGRMWRLLLLSFYSLPDNATPTRTQKKVKHI